MNSDLYERYMRLYDDIEKVFQRETDDLPFHERNYLVMLFAAKLAARGVADVKAEGRERLLSYLSRNVRQFIANCDAADAAEEGEAGATTHGDK